MGLVWFFKKYSRTALFILFIISLSITLLLIKTRQDLRQRAQKEPGTQTQSNLKTYKELRSEGEISPLEKVIETTIKFDEKSNPQISIANVERKNGYVSKIPPDQYSYFLNLHDQNNNVLFTQGFRVTQIKFNPPPKPGENPKEHAPEILQQSSIIINLPSLKNATLLSITDNHGKKAAEYALRNLKTVENPPTFNTFDENSSNSLFNFLLKPKQSYAQTTAEKADIVFLSDRYTNQSQFLSDAAVLSQTLLSYDPFRGRQNDFRFSTVFNTVQLCGETSSDGWVACDVNKALQIVNNSGIQADTIVVVVNHTADFSFTYMDQRVLFKTMNGEWFREGFIHEFGHAFGRLEDEYLYGTDNPNLQAEKNCFNGTPPNSRWAGIVPTNSYFRECGNSYYWRSTETSLMRSIYDHSLIFNPISQKYLTDMINFYAGTPTPTPTLTPTLTKTPTPTPTKTPTPTIQTRKPGDANGDNLVNLTDLSILLSNWNSTTFSNADFNNDGRVGITDLSILLSNWGL